jgi:hypothetical protein
MEEPTPGTTISALYREPTLDQLDSPNNYLTAMISENGHTVVILKTGQKIERRDDIFFDPAAPPGDLVALLNPDALQPPAPGQPPEVPPDPGIQAAPNDFTEEMPAGVVTTKDCFDAQFEVKAASLTWGVGGPEVPITVLGKFARPLSGDQSAPAWAELLNGKPVNPVTGVPLFGGGDVDGGETDSRVLRANESFTLEATATYGYWSATLESNHDTSQVLTLRNGDLPLEFDPYRNPIQVGTALQGMINPATGKVTIGNNQVLYLFELGATSRQQATFDLQDLIVLVTLTAPADPSQCEDPPTPPEPPAPPEEEGFDVQPDGDVVTKMCSDVKIKALGSQFGYADGTLVDIVAAAKMDTDWFPLYANQPIHGGETYNQASVKAGTNVVVKAEIAGEYERWLWTRYGYPLSYTSNDGSGQVVILRSGDTPINNNPAYPYQVGVSSLLAPYVANGVISIAANEALYCFDFNPLHTHQGIDYNDLVILATATAAEVACEDETPPPGDPARPVLTLRAAADSTIARQVQFEAKNTAAAGNPAANVRTVCSIVSGAEYVQQISYDGNLGSINAGSSKFFSVQFYPKSSLWANAPVNTEVRVRATVSQETNDPNANVGKYADVVFLPLGHTLTGSINLNPNNNDDFEFRLVKSGGGIITRDNLLASNGTLTYNGEATEVRVRPKGNGNQNSLTMDGTPYPLRNGTVFLIQSTSMTVHLYNSKGGQGGAMGKWWIEISASQASISTQ